MSHLIAVKHNIEVAHRLFLLPGKCENIHGHSMWITLYLKGELNARGILEGIDFGFLKKEFRKYLDDNFDHHVVLNSLDPWAQEVAQYDTVTGKVAMMNLPGLTTIHGDPSTENIAMLVGEMMQRKFEFVSAVEVWETSVNMARWEA